MWQRPNGQQGLGGLKTRDLPLYGVERLAAVPAGATVVVTEGEPPADALTARGVIAVGTAFRKEGSSPWPAASWS